MVKCVSVLGSTGSIGRQSLDVISRMDIRVAALTAGTSVDRMAQQCRDSILFQLCLSPSRLAE